MSFILKTFNRKVLSGSTLKAKIVYKNPETNEVSTDIGTATFPIIVQKQKATDEEAVISTIARMSSVLDSQNAIVGSSEWDVTNGISGISDARDAKTDTEVNIGPAKIYAQNGTEDSTYIGSDGALKTRPLYGEGSQTLTLKFKVSKNSVEKYYTKQFTLPAYTVDNIKSTISTYFANNSNALFNAIKNKNTNANYVWSDLTDLSSSTETASLLSKIGVSQMCESAYMPTISMTYPSYYSNLFSNNGAYNQVSASTMYKYGQTNSNVIINNILDNATIKNNLSGYDSFNKQYRNEILAYQMKSNVSTDNNVTAVFTIKSVSNGIDETIDQKCSINVISSKINIDDIKNNIESSLQTIWLFGNDLMNGYSFTNQAITSNSSSNRQSFIIPTNKNIILRLPSTISDIGYYDGSKYIGTIEDSSNIGYYIDDNGLLNGFTDSLIQFSLSIDNPNALTIYYGDQNDFSGALSDLTTDSIASATSTGSLSVSTSVNTTFNIDSMPQSYYVAIDQASSASSITGKFDIKIVESNLGVATVLATIYFTITRS